MLKPFLILSALVLTGALASPPQSQQPPQSEQPPQSQQPGSPAPPAIPLDAVKQVNPVKSSAESLSRAKKIYGYECAACHGDDGGGAGDLAKNMKSKLGDFRDPSTLKGHTDGELFYIIKNGKGEMEGEGARVKADDTWNLVNYLRSLSKGQTSPAAQGPA